MRRVVWIAVGVGATVIVIRKFGQVRGIAALATPAGIGVAINNLADSLSELTKEFRDSMAAHEESLTDALIKGEGKAANIQQGRGEESFGRGDSPAWGGSSQGSRGAGSGYGAYDLDDALLDEADALQEPDSWNDPGRRGPSHDQDGPR